MNLSTPSRVEIEPWIQMLKFPDDKLRIALMSLAHKEKWYSAQEPRFLVYLSNTVEFREFWDLFYVRPLHIKRALYRLKFW